jgi:hypothetical protein
MLPHITDLKMIMSQLPLPERLEMSVSQDVWFFTKNDWKSRSDALGKYELN